MEFNKKLQELRKENGITQEELSKILYVSRTAVSKWESGRGYPNLDSLKRIAEYFNVTVDQLLSSKELLTVAESDSKKKRQFLLSIIYALVDISFLTFFIIPFFAERIDGKIYQVTLFSLISISTWLKIVYIVGLSGLFLVGILGLFLQKESKKIGLRYTMILSLTLNVILTVIFITSLQAYASVLAFTFLLIKTIPILKSK